MKLEDRLKRIKSGQDDKLYEYLGSHLATKGGKAGAYFRVYAPNAEEIFVVGDFNDWNETSNPLKRIKNSDVWEVFVPKAKKLQKYKYIIVDRQGSKQEKADPFAFYGQNKENDGDFASYIYDIDGFKWSDKKYLEQVETKNHLKAPMNIYEVCLLSWKRHTDGSYYSYRELATTLIPYCKKMGYTHIELLPISEFPRDISWGYQVMGYFGATSRYGKPKDLMYFVDKCHEAGLGVILDWVPAHFDFHEFGLMDFDGTSLYESPKWDRKFQLAWSTRIFDYENPYVCGFLIASALFYLRKYHFDGIRVDAVVSILYLDFCRNPDEWIPNVDGNNINYAGVEFLKKLNTTIYSEFPDAIMVAEEVSSWPMVTKPVSSGGLGFLFKWNVGWINDIWEYTSMDPYFRKYHHNILTHTIDYCFDENYILPIDHDEVGNGRHSLLNKMNGDMKTKIDLCRAFYLYMFMHPGKKLSFMGCEFGQIQEWQYDKPLTFALLKADKYKKFNKFIQTLNKLYVKTPEMYEADHDPSGFEWLVKNDNSRCVCVFKRNSSSGSYLISFTNFSPYRIDDYVLGIDEPGTYEVVFSTDDEAFGGTGEEYEILHSFVMNKNGKNNAIRFDVPANTSILIKRTEN